MLTFPKRVRLTKADKLQHVLADREWHTTRELIRRVGHTFAVAKFKLCRRRYRIEVERHPTKPRQFRYRLAYEPND